MPRGSAAGRPGGRSPESAARCQVDELIDSGGCGKEADSTDYCIQAAQRERGERLEQLGKLLRVGVAADDPQMQARHRLCLA